MTWKRSLERNSLALPFTVYDSEMNAEKEQQARAAMFHDAMTIKEAK